MELTKAEKFVFDRLSVFMKNKGRAPSFDELRQACGFKSKGMVSKYLDRLEAKGLIKKEEGVSRSIQIV